MKRILLLIAKITGITLGSILLLLFLLPALFPGAVAGKIKQWTNEAITGQVNFSKVRLSFFRHFPNLTLTLHDFSLTGSEPFAADTLMAGEALSFGIDLASLFEETLEVNRFFVDGALINVQVDEQGAANYNIYKGSADTTAVDSSETRLRIEGVIIRNSRLVYHDRSIPMLIRAEGFRYEGSGDLANSQFDLQSNMHADSLDFSLDGTEYIRRKKLEADLLTGINTSSLVFRFAKNNLLVNQLPVDFTGSMAILKDGYDIDLHVVSGVTDFGNIFSALPPDYDAWFADTQFSGRSQVKVDMAGSYRAATGQAPDLNVQLRVHDGLINHKQAPAPLEHVWINGAVRIPGLNPDSMSLTVDTLQFDLVDGKTNAVILVKGIDEPYIRASIDSRIDLTQLDRTLGLSFAEMRGNVRLKAELDGYYRTGQNPDRIRPDTVITSIPAFQLEADLIDGFFHYTGLPLALDQLAAKVQATCPSGRLQDISLAIREVNAQLGEGRLAGNLSVKGLNPYSIQTNLTANLQLEDLAQAVPIENYLFGGALTADISADGVLDLEKKRFPSADGSLKLQNGRIQTPYYPNPIEQLQIDARIKSNRYDDLSVQLQPVSLVFEGQPFTVSADVQNPGNLRYAVTADGTLDLGKVYQVFAVKGYGVTGLLQADLDLRGTAASPLTGKNKGNLRVQNLELRSDDYPFPFQIPKANLRFDQDKAWLDNTLLRYRQNEFTLDGYTQNFIAYVLDGSLLSGLLSVKSPKLTVDDFMVFSTSAGAPTAPSAPSSPGVVLLPADMDLTLEASIKEILYGTTQLRDFSGKLSLQKGKLILEKTQVGIAGATIRLDGDYTPVDLRKATFSASFKADSFDVRRAYEEIPLFREMASAAAYAEGIVSVDYQVQGRLNDRMEPVYPSIKGGGILKLEQVKMKGFNLFGAVAKTTGKDSINNPDLKAVVMKSSIANNILTIERTRMKVFGFRPRIEGQASLDGKLNLRFRLGLPPFGALGIPMTITGTGANPIVEIRRGKEADELEEVEVEIENE